MHNTHMYYNRPVTKKLDLGENWPGGPIFPAKSGPGGPHWNAINGPCVRKMAPPQRIKLTCEKDLYSEFLKRVF